MRLLSGLETALPPVIVHRPTMRIVDGMHRLRAAALRGDKTIRARFFEGDESDAFVIAVSENTAHGLPLSAGERAAAADRVVRSHPHWSDREIARIAGLSARAVSDIRRAAFAEGSQPMARLGRDGRVRPLNSSDGRIRAAKLIATAPHASLRQIAQQTGISPGTVRDVRDRLRRGEDPLPTSLRSISGRSAPGSQNRSVPPDTHEQTVPSGQRRARSLRPERGQGRTSLEILIKDPSLWSAERGRLLLRLLSITASLTPCRKELIEAVPGHCIGLVYQVAKESAAAWATFVDDLEQRAMGATTGTDG
ncbi:ParB/RepB/Spo0J family partition protein [Sphaerisporangium sp. NPDC004334]